MTGAGVADWLAAIFFFLWFVLVFDGKLIGEQRVKQTAIGSAFTALRSLAMETELGQASKRASVILTPP